MEAKKKGYGRFPAITLNNMNIVVAVHNPQTSYKLKIVYVKLQIQLVTEYIFKRQ